MTALTETQHPGEFILAEPEPLISREVVTVTVAAGAKLQSGHVLGLLTAGGYVEYDNAATDGSEAAAAILYTEADNTDGGAPADFAVTIIKRFAAVRKDALQWITGASAGDKTAAYADLAALYIIARD